MRDVPKHSFFKLNKPTVVEVAILLWTTQAAGHLQSQKQDTTRTAELQPGRKGHFITNDACARTRACVHRPTYTRPIWVTQNPEQATIKKICPLGSDVEITCTRWQTPPGTSWVLQITPAGQAHLRRQPLFNSGLLLLSTKNSGLRLQYLSAITAIPPPMPRTVPGTLWVHKIHLLMVWIIINSIFLFSTQYGHILQNSRLNPQDYSSISSVQSKTKRSKTSLVFSS